MDFVDCGEDDDDQSFICAYQTREQLEKEYTALKSKENEDQIELRRLRTENRLLRQRIDNLEKESASLADRLIQYQLTRAQEAEETYALKNELSLTKQKCAESQKNLKEAQTLLGDIKERTDSINSASSLDEGEAHVVIQGLQEELIMVRLREAENNTTLKNLRNKIEELEQLNTQIQQAPSNDVQCLQEELIAVKLREAEANLSLKEMRQTVADLDANWQRHLANADLQNSPRDKSSKSELKAELKKTQEDLMSSKLREASALSHLKDTKQRVMELETSNQICTNQIRRMDEENKKIKAELEEAGRQEGELHKQIKTLLRKMDDLESTRREEMMMARIREAENDQIIGELKQKIAEIEIQREEVLAADRLKSKGGKQDLENTIFDLQEEVLQLKLSASPKSPNTSTSSASGKTSDKLDDDDDFDDDDDIEDPESLNRTLSEIIEGKRSSNSLIAILNRENSDCDSIKSSSSDQSASSLKSRDKVPVRGREGEVVNKEQTCKEMSKCEGESRDSNKLCDTSNDGNSAIDKSRSVTETQSRLSSTDSIKSSSGGSESGRNSVNQSNSHETGGVVNGEASQNTHSAVDSNRNSIDGVKLLSGARLDTTESATSVT